jgi:cytochrome c peroxidase
VRQIAQTIEAFEASTLASPFASKFDAMLKGNASFTPAEQRGYALFTGRAKCAACHDATGPTPLFTNFTSANIGVPRNPALPFLTETAADGDAYVANPQGAAFVDEGLGGFLASPADTNPQWRAQAARFMGAFQVPTLRNVALRHAYMHNGAFNDLATVVHFLNTRDTQHWTPPEEPRNVNTALTGNLGLSAADERDLVAFLGTLSDRP